MHALETKCRLNASFLLNAFPHNSQVYGRTGRWIFACRFKSWFLLNDKEHCGHGNCLLVVTGATADRDGDDRPDPGLDPDADEYEKACC